MIYPGERGSKPDEICLARDVFGIDPENAFVNVKAKIIYDSKQGDIINQYIVFCRVFDEQIKLHGRTKKAVDETIRICKDRDVLKDYLAKEEVTDIMFGYFDYEKELEFLRQEERAEGRAEGALGMLVNLVKQGLLSPENAAKQANMTVAEFEKQAALLYA